MPHPTQQAELRALGDGRARAGARLRRRLGTRRRRRAPRPAAEDARFTMPPMPDWFFGRERVGRFFAERVFATPWRLVPLAANGQLAFACYRAREGDQGVAGPPRRDQLVGLRGWRVASRPCSSTWPCTDTPASPRTMSPDPRRLSPGEGRTQPCKACRCNIMSLDGYHTGPGDNVMAMPMDELRRLQRRTPPRRRHAAVRTRHLPGVRGVLAAAGRRPRRPARPPGDLAAQQRHQEGGGSDTLLPATPTPGGPPPASSAAPTPTTRSPSSSASRAGRP